MMLYIGTKLAFIVFARSSLICLRHISSQQLLVLTTVSIHGQILVFTVSDSLLSQNYVFN